MDMSSGHSMHKKPKQVKKKTQKKDVKTMNKAGAIHGLIGLELTALRKSFNGETKYNFEKYLEDGIPDSYPIEYINSKEEMESIKNILIPVENSEITVHSFEELRHSIKGDYTLNLIDHKPPPLDKLYDQNFIKAHEKLAKHEKKYNIEDKQKIVNEVDNSIELLSILGIELKRTNMKETLEKLCVDEIELSEDQLFRLSQILGTITYIKDPTDTAEMILKFKLTIRELRSFLLSYLRMKSLEGMLKRRISDENFELFNIPNGETKEKRAIVDGGVNDIVGQKKPRKKAAPKFRVKLKILNTARFKEIVENAPKLPPKKRGPYKKRVKKTSENNKKCSPSKTIKNEKDVRNDTVNQVALNAELNTLNSEGSLSVNTNISPIYQASKQKLE